jgi:hypothetical protein
VDKLKETNEENAKLFTKGTDTSSPSYFYLVNNGGIFLSSLICGIGLGVAASTVVFKAFPVTTLPTDSIALASLISKNKFLNQKLEILSK